MHRLYLPEGIDLSCVPKRQRHNAEWFIHSLYTRRTTRKLARDAFVTMHSRILDRIMGHTYAKLINAMVNCDLVEKDHYIIRGKKSQGYRLTLPYRHQVHRLGQLANKPLCTKLDRHKADRRALWSPVHHYLFSWLNKVELWGNLKRYKAQTLPIARIQDKDFFCKVDKYGRVHSNVTNLKRTLRQYLHLEGHNLCELDIRNSQPLLLCILMRQLYSTGNLDHINSYYNHTQETTHHILPLCSPFSDERTLPRDVLAYQSLCESGNLYESLMDVAEVKRRKRKRFKKRIISRVFYCRNNRQENPLSTIFASMFPSVMDCIRALKKDDYRHLSHLLQRVESDLIVHRVCGRLLYEYDALPVLTVHDSLLTPTQHLDTVISVLMEESHKLGIHPTLH